MRERTEYPAGVPCWVDTGQPEGAPRRLLRRAVRMGVRGPICLPTLPAATWWPGSEGRDVAAVGSQPRGAPAPSGAPTSRSTTPTRPRERGTGGAAVLAPFDVSDAGGWACSPTPRAR